MQLKNYITLTYLLTIITAIIGVASLIDYSRTWETLTLSFMNWLVIWILTVFAFIFSVPVKFYTKQTAFAVLSLPMGFWLIIRSLFRLKGANKTFIHTQHGVSEKNKRTD
jgi:glucan phosphoethanolaminetransferase (alkaline phosphatase superfamily)